MIRPGVHSLHEHTYGTDLSEAIPGDTAVVFDFFRYRRQVAHTTHVLAESGIEIVAVTDSPLSPLVELADAWCEIEVPAVGPFDSSVPAVAIAELLVAKAAKELQQEATARIDRIEALWEKTEAFL
jgi:DNA-binding MurR/RpiR family transcriptional regulator